MIEQQNNSQSQIIIRPEFDKLKIQLTKINEIALEIKQRQIRIINTANIINNKLRSSIEDNIKDTNVIAQTEQRIKNLHERIDKDKIRVINIREKFLMLKKLYRQNKSPNDNKFNISNFSLLALFLSDPF